MTSKKVVKERLIVRFFKAPIRALIKVRDLYILGMTECSGHFDYGAVIGCPTVQVSTLPRSYSVSSTTSSGNDDYRELMRAASTRGSLGNKVGLENTERKNQPIHRLSSMSSPSVVPRSQSVGIGRIDEDKPCEFGDDVMVQTDLYPRSRSYAVHRRNMGF